MIKPTRSILILLGFLILTALLGIYDPAFLLSVIGQKVNLQPENHQAHRLEFFKHLFLIATASFSFIYSQYRNRRQVAKTNSYEMMKVYSSDRFRTAYANLNQYYQDPIIFSNICLFNSIPSDFFNGLATFRRSTVDVIPEERYITLENDFLIVFDYFEQMASCIFNEHCDNKILFDSNAGILLTRIVPLLLIHYERLNKHRQRPDLYEKLFELYNFWVGRYNIAYHSRVIDRSLPFLKIDSILGRSTNFQKIITSIHIGIQRVFKQNHYSA